MSWQTTRLELEGTRISVELRDPKKNGWAVICNGRLNKNTMEFDYEPLPSSRTDEWIEAHTFYDASEACKFAEIYAQTNQ